MLHSCSTVAGTQRQGTVSRKRFESRSCAVFGARGAVYERALSLLVEHVVADQ